MTIVHAGGSRKRYPARVIGGFVFLEVPMSEHRRFRLSDGRPTLRRLAAWKLDEDDLEACRALRRQGRRNRR